jgi:hypothetical protein
MPNSSCKSSRKSYATAYHPLYGEPVDPHLLNAFREQVETLDHGFALSDPLSETLRIPFERTSLPALTASRFDFATCSNQARLSGRKLHQIWALRRWNCLRRQNNRRPAELP